MPRLEYPVIIEPLPEDEGGGFVALVAKRNWNMQNLMNIS